MVDGVHGHVGHAVQHVVMEQSNVVENVIILYLPVEEMIAQGQIVAKFHVTPTAVMVRLQHKCMVIIICNTEMKYVHTYIWCLQYNHKAWQQLQHWRDFSISQHRAPCTILLLLHVRLLCMHDYSY